MLEDISLYFTPLVSSYSLDSTNGGTLGSQVDIYTENHFPDLKEGTIAMFHVPEFRGISSQVRQPETFRQQLYALHPASNWTRSIVDLGNVLPGRTIEDTYFAMGKIVAYLVKRQIIPLIIGGSQDLTVAIYKGYETMEQFVNLCTIDSRLDLGTFEGTIRANGYISQLLFQRPCYLFNLSNIGMQLPLVDKKEIELFDNLYFDCCRLGELTADFKKAEPYLRNADILSIDLTSVRYADLNDPQYVNPNGLYAEQMCQLARYAGISDKLTTLGIFNYFPEQTLSQNLSSLVAQMIWYFMDGVNARMGDFPIGTRKHYTQFIVQTETASEELIFYKSDKSARWWLEVPYPAQGNNKYERHYLVPCNYEDYKKATQNEIPDLWWKTYQKLV